VIELALLNVEDAVLEVALPRRPSIPANLVRLPSIGGTTGSVNLRVVSDSMFKVSQTCCESFSIY